MTEVPIPLDAVRILPSVLGPVIPAVDIALAIGYHRSAITKMMAGHPDMFKGLTSTQPIDTGSRGQQPAVCLNSKGVRNLVLLLQPSAKKRPALYARVEDFKAAAYRKIGAPDEPAAIAAPIPDLPAELIEARSIAEACQKSPEVFQAAILRKHGKPELADALQVPAAPSLIHGERGWYNASQLAEMCGIDRAEYVNNYLHNHGWIYRDAAEGRVWRLQPMAMDHGREYWFEAPSGHREIRIAWRESILYAAGLKRTVSDDQMALPARAGVGSGA